MNTNYSYDSLSRLLSILHQVGTNTIDGATYTYDNVGNRLTKLNQLNSVTETYGYDNIYQLLSVLQGATTTESYTYDKVGNRLSSLGGITYTVNGRNQLTTVSGSPNTTFTYDNNGNTATKVDGSGTTTYTWNSQNQLKQVALPGGATVTFKYDPFGRRVQKVSASGTINYVYDGVNVIEELDSAGAVIAKYAQGPGVDQSLAMLRGGTTSFYEADGLGSVTSLTDNSGAVTNSYTYEAFAKMTASSGTITNSLRYTARDYENELNLQYYRTRYYDPQIGRFTTEDLARFDGGINLYRYVNNNPVNFTDPFGLSPKPVKPYRWRDCTPGEETVCRQICAVQGKKFESCRVSQRFRIGPGGLEDGLVWMDGPLSCSCKEEECSKANQPDPEQGRAFIQSLIVTGIVVGIALAPEFTIPMLPRLVPAFAH